MLESVLVLFAGEEIMNLISQSGPVAKVVLVVLLAFSILSWAIILSKLASLRRARVQSGRFVRAFRKANRLQDVSAVAEQFRPSPLGAAFEGGFEELRRQGGTARNVNALQRAMHIGSSEELTRLPSRVYPPGNTRAVA